jgi:hypothetical protein
MFYERVDLKQDLECVRRLSHGSSIYISIAHHRNVRPIVDILLKKSIQVYFYLMYEPVVQKSIIDELLPVSIHIFVQNNIYDHPQVHIMPIGIRDCAHVVPVHRGFVHDYLYNEGMKTVKKTHLCLLCFTGCDHPNSLLMLCVGTALISELDILMGVL